MAFKRKPPPLNVRRVRSLGTNFRGVTTNKRGRLVQFESELERKLILLLERDTSVADYISQPETLTFRDKKDRPRSYTPDFKVLRTDGCIELHEVTVQSRRENKASLKEREAAAQAICHQRGWRYLVHTDETLPNGYEYANLDFLADFRGQVYSNPDAVAWWMGQLKIHPIGHPRSLLVQGGSTLDSGHLLNSLYHLIWHGVVQITWDQPFIWRGDFHPAVHIWLL